MAKLICLTGNDTGYEFPLTPGDNILGRGEDNQVCLLDKRSSRRNAKLDVQPGRYTLEDMSSRNGTFVNGKAIYRTQVLALGDHIRIGKTLLELSEVPLDKIKVAPLPRVRESRLSFTREDDDHDDVSLLENKTVQSTVSSALSALFRRK